MNPVKIAADSCIDLPKESRERYDIDYLKMNIMCCGGFVPHDLDWQHMDPDVFYARLRRGDCFIPEKVSPAATEQFFTQYLSRGFDVVFVACSGKLSQGITVARETAVRLQKQFPQASVFCVDSLNVGAGEGALAIAAAKLRDEGKSAAEIAKMLCERRNRVNLFAMTDNLTPLIRANRINLKSAHVGNLLDIKTIIISDSEGNIVPLKSVRGRNRAMEALVRLAAGSIEFPETQTVLIRHSDCSDDANAMAQMMMRRIPAADVHVGTMSPVIGASVGANALSIAVEGKDVRRFIV